MLRRYEAGWRWRGVLAGPSADALRFIRDLAARYGTVIRDLDDLAQFRDLEKAGNH